MTLVYSGSYLFDVLAQLYLYEKVQISIPNQEAEERILIDDMNYVISNNLSNRWKYGEIQRIQQFGNKSIFHETCYTVLVGHFNMRKKKTKHVLMLNLVPFDNGLWSVTHVIVDNKCCFTFQFGEQIIKKTNVCDKMTKHIASHPSELLSRCLYKIGERICPTPDQIKQSNHLIKICSQTITECMAQSLGFNRLRVVGSFRRKTAIGERYDIDITLFYNFSDVSTSQSWIKKKIIIIGHLKDALNNVPCINNIESNDFGLKLVACDTKIDLIIACNMLEGLPTIKHPAVEQFDRTMDAIRQSKEPKHLARLLSASKGEILILWMGQMSSFIHSLVRLAKFMFIKRIPTTIRLPGRSSTVELVAIKAGIEEETYAINQRLERPKMICALKRFLLYWENADTMAIEFPIFYKSNDISKEKKIPPYIIDPIDPFNNRLRSCSDRDLNVIKKTASVTLKDLLDLEQGSLNFDLFNISLQ